MFDKNEITIRLPGTVPISDIPTHASISRETEFAGMRSYCTRVIHCFTDARVGRFFAFRAINCRDNDIAKLSCEIFVLSENPLDGRNFAIAKLFTFLYLIMFI